MPLNILDCYSTPPRPRDYILPGMIPGIVGSIVAPGATGKSMMALMLAHLVGGGVNLLELGSVSTGKVVYLSAEDGSDILHERLHEIGKLLSPTDRISCASSIQIEDLTRHNPDLLHGKKVKYWREALVRVCTGTRILFLDTIRSFHSGDENNGGEMTELINLFRATAAMTNCSIVFLHHVSKASAMSGMGDIQQAARGSSVLTDNIRWQAFLVGMTIDESAALSYRLDRQPIGPDDRSYFVRFGISKQNYGPPHGERWFRRGPGGILEPITLNKANKPLKATSGKGGRASA